MEINQILLGDCLEHISNLEDNSVDCILTDPPYGISRKSNLHTLNNPRFGLDFGEWDCFSSDWLKLACPKLKVGANVIVFNSWQNLSKLSDVMSKNAIEPKRVMFYKRTNPFPINRDRMPVNVMDFMIWGVYKNKKWTFNRREGSPYETGIFNYPVQKKTIHPTPKPVGLIEDLLQIFTNENDLVLDPFAGSCTLAVACRNVIRNYICIEKEKLYFDKALERINGTK